jgi:signal transduction histidine kinase
VPDTTGARRAVARLREVPPLLQDLVLAAVIGLLQLGLVYGASGGALNGVLALVEPLALLLRRSRPIVTVAVVGVVDAVLLLTGAPPSSVGASMVVAAFSAGAYLNRRAGLGALALALAFQVVHGGLRTDEISPVDVIGVWLITATAWWLGATIRERRRYASELEQRTRALEAARLELAEQAVAAERLRLARELHDVVAHSLAIIAVHSSVGAHNAAERPQDAVEALEAINTATRSALAELRALLAVLRSTGADVAPLPTLADLTALADQAGAAGVELAIRIDGDPTTVPRAVGLSAYRIVQEAVTNALKHAAPSAVDVAVRVTSGQVAVEVSNEPGTGSAVVGGAGAGLAGMRERVTAFGGTLEAAPTDGGGWTVRATLPYDEMVTP